jgi:hypothetical protein
MILAEVKVNGIHNQLFLHEIQEKTSVMSIYIINLSVFEREKRNSFLWDRQSKEGALFLKRQVPYIILTLRGIP